MTIITKFLGFLGLAKLLQSTELW